VSKLEENQRADVLEIAERIRAKMMSIASDLEYRIEDAKVNGKEHRLGERFTHTLMWGFANLKLDQLVTRCTDLTATMGERGDVLHHGVRKS